MTRSDLHHERYQKERLTAEVDRFIAKAYPGIDLSSLISCRKRLLHTNINIDQARILSSQVDGLTRNEKEMLGHLGQSKLPVENMIEYISAPGDTLLHGDHIEIRETIYGRLISGLNLKSAPLDPDSLTKHTYFGAFVAASSSLTFLATRSLETTSLEWYVRPLSDLFNRIETGIPNALAAAGFDPAEVASQYPMGGGAVVGLFLLGAWHQWQKNKSTAPNLFQAIHRPSSGVAQALYGDDASAEIRRQYENLQERDKFLLKHLSPFELRVALLGSKESAMDMLTHRPVPFENQVAYCAYDSKNLMEFISKMMDISLPNFIKMPGRLIARAVGAEAREAIDPRELAERIHRRRGADIQQAPQVALPGVRPGI